MQVNDISELQKNICLLSNESEIIERFFSYSKLLRIVVYCLRMFSGNKYIGSLCVEEIDEAKIRVLKIVQAAQFSAEIKIL